MDSYLVKIAVRSPNIINKYCLLTVATPFASSWSPYGKTPDSHHKSKLNFLPKIQTGDKFKFVNFIGIPKIHKYEKPTFGKVSEIPTNANDDTVKFEMANWPAPIFKYDIAKFGKANAHEYNKLEFEGMSGRPKKDNYDKSKFEAVRGSINFLKDLDLRPQETFDLNDLKCQYKNRIGECKSYIKKKQNIATVSQLENMNRDVLRTPSTYSQEDFDDDYSAGSESHEDLTRVVRGQIRTDGTVSEDYIDFTNKLLIRERDNVKPEVKTKEGQQKKKVKVLSNALRKPLVVVARKALSHKKNKNSTEFKTTLKKTDLNITFTPLKFYRADNEEEDSDSSEEDEVVTAKVTESKTTKAAEVSDESIDEPDNLTNPPITLKAKKEKRNRFSVIDNEKLKAKKKKKIKAKISNEMEVSNSAQSGEQKSEIYKYKSDESYGSSEKLSIETYDQSSEYTTLKPKKKKKKTSTAYMYMQGPQRLYTDSEEETRRIVQVHNTDKNIEQNYRSNNNEKNNKPNNKKSVSEDYIDLENHRRTVPSFLPKRYFWKNDELQNLGYFWFNGPQGYVPGPYKISY